MKHATLRAIVDLLPRYAHARRAGWAPAALMSGYITLPEYLLLRRVRATIQSLPPERFPNMVEAAEPLSTRTDPDAYYTFGVDLLMAGIEAMARRSATENT